MDHPPDRFPAFVDSIYDRPREDVRNEKSKAARRRRRLRRRRKVRSTLRFCFFCALLYFVGHPVWKFANSPSPWAFEPEAKALLLDHEDQPLLSWPEYGDRRPVSFSDLRKDTVNAVLAREDQRFFSHPGVDPQALARAAVVDFKARSIVQGGSTITMQLVERVYGFPQDTKMNKFRAKVFELLMAPRIELYALRKYGSRKAGKEAILASYLSRVEYGYQTVGLREAAHCYFGKSVNRLTLGESAYLAGLIRGPSVNNAYHNPDNARRARDAVIRNMVELGMVSEKDSKNGSFYVSARPHRKSRQGDGFLSAAVRRELDELVAAGKLRTDYASADRLRVVTTFDPEVQEIAELALRKRIQQIESTKGFRVPKGRLQGSVVVVDNETGAVIASVGGRDFDKLSYDCALQARRTVASAGKPFLYATLMNNRGMSAKDEVSNAKLRSFESPEFPGLRDPRETPALEEGMHPLWKGLAHSSNRMTLRVGDAAGFVSWTGLLRSTGLVGEAPPKHTSSWLGTFGVRPVDLAAAYSVFPRGGNYHKPWFVERVEIGGRTVFRHRNRSKEVLPTRVCNEITASLREVLRQGTTAPHGGATLAKKFHLAGKTGTSDGVADAWFAGYSSSVTVVVWIGLPEGNRTILEGETGGSLSFPVWRSVMEGLPQERYPFHGLADLRVKRPELASW